MKLVRITESFIRKLKGDPSYAIASDYSNRQFSAILVGRLLQVLRGIGLKFRLNSSSGVIFAGRRVVIEHAYAISVGGALILEDNVQLNALSKNGIKLGSNVTIAKGAILVCTGVISRKGEGIVIGDNSAVGAQSFLSGQGGIHIGNNVIMGPQVKIFSENHRYDKVDVVIRKQGESRKGVHIENDCWIGAGVTILDGVRIGEGSVVAAGAVVTKNLPAYSVSGGIPAKILKYRLKE